MSTPLNDIASWPRVVPTKNHNQQQVIEESETAMNGVHSPLENDVQGPSQHGYTQNIHRPRAATIMNPIEEEAIEEASTAGVNDLINGPDNYNEEAAQQQEWHNLNDQGAAMTASHANPFGYFNGKITPMMDNILSRSESLIANAAQHEHNQDVPTCTDEQHNKNCGRGTDMALLEYNYLRSKGVIPERPYEHWGCDTPERKDYLKAFETCHVRVAFRPVKWDTEYTGRGCMSFANFSVSVCGLLTNE